MRDIQSCVDFVTPLHVKIRVSQHKQYAVCRSKHVNSKGGQVGVEGAYSMSKVSPSQKSRGLRIPQMSEYPQCLLMMSAKFSCPGIWLKTMYPRAITLQTKWKESMLCCLCSLAWSCVALLTTDSLLPKT